MADASDTLALATAADTVRPGLVVYRVGGREYPMKTAKGCLTCQSHYRIPIESLVIGGCGYAKAVREYPKAKLTARNIQDHISNGHLPIKLAARRDIIEDRAKQLGRSLEQDTSLADYITVARLGVQRYFEYTQENDNVPSETMVLGMMNLLAKVDAIAKDESLDQASMVQGVMIFMESARAIMTPEQFQRFGSRLNTNTALAALLGRVTAIEAEVIDEAEIDTSEDAT